MESLLFKEIMEEAEGLDLTYSSNFPKLKNIVEEIKEKKITNVVIVGRGSSDNVGIYFKYLFENYCHLPVSFAAASLVIKYDNYLNLSTTLVLAISQSGAGVDIYEYCKMANANGAVTLSITNDPNSIISKECNYNLNLNLKKEMSLAATKTFISSMYLALLFVKEYSNNKDFHNIETILKNSILELQNKHNDIEEYKSYFVDLIDCYFLSRGFNLVSSFESALKLQETTYIKAKAYPLTDFYHGPFAIADENQNFVVFANEGICLNDSIEMIEKLNKVNANVLVIGNADNIKNEKIIKTVKVPEIITPFIDIITIQILCNAIAFAKGLNPDQPRGLKKVTVTR